MPRKKTSDDIVTIRGHDLDELHRCAYRLAIGIHDKVSPAYLLSEDFREAILAPAVAFESKVLSQFEWEETKESLEQLVEQGVTMIKHPYLTLMHQVSGRHYVRLVGVPDLLVRNPLDPAYYCPVDIKHHAQVSDVDRRRVEFYSLILRKLFYSRNRAFSKSPASTIHGYVWLTADPIKLIDALEAERTERPAVIKAEPVEASRTFSVTKDIEEIWRLHRMWRVKNPEQAMPSARELNIKYMHVVDPITAEVAKEFVSPRRILKECRRCKLKEECSKSVALEKGLTCIREIGPVRESLFEACGMRNYDELFLLGECWKETPNVSVIERKLTEVFGDSWRPRINAFGVTLEKILHSVKAVVEKKAFQIAPINLPNAQTEFFVDLEYNSFPFCLAAKIIPKREETVRFQRFAETSRESRKAVEELKNLLASHKNSVVYTWGGQDKKLLGLGEKHVDLYYVVNRCIILPMKSFNAKDVATYFGHTHPPLPIKNGLACLLSYVQYKNEKDKERKRKIRKEIEEYNRNDVESLHVIARAVQSRFKRRAQIPTSHVRVPRRRGRKHVAHEASVKLAAKKSRVKGKTYERFLIKIPATLVRQPQFPFAPGDLLMIMVDPRKKKLILKRI